MKQFKTIAITGGAGYIGSALVPQLLKKGYYVKVLDLFIYGENVFGDYINNPQFERIKGDIRNIQTLEKTFRDVDVVIHLACISNDPSFELDPKLGKGINLDAFDKILTTLEKTKVKRFIYASSTSVYGIRKEKDVTEDSPKTPLTDYSRFKLLCEEKLMKWSNPNQTEWAIIRPATACGYSHRLRLDLTVNILAIYALINRKIIVFGGKQLRPNIHINDMVRAYITLLESGREKINGDVFNAGYQNRSVEDIAFMVKQVLKDLNIDIEYIPTDDIRSYHINSDKIKNELGFKAKYTIEDAILSIAKAYNQGLINDGLNNSLYHNVKRMREINLK